MMVNLWMPWMSILDKKYEEPEKRKKNIKLNDTKYQNVN